MLQFRHNLLLWYCEVQLFFGVQFSSLFDKNSTFFFFFLRWPDMILDFLGLKQARCINPSWPYFTCPFISCGRVGKQIKVSHCLLVVQVTASGFSLSFYGAQSPGFLFDTKSKMRHGNIIFTVAMSWQIAPYALLTKQHMKPAAIAGMYYQITDIRDMKDGEKRHCMHQSVDLRHMLSWLYSVFHLFFSPFQCNVLLHL